MSVHVSSFVWKNSKEKGNGLLMLLALADACNDDGECWLGVTSLQERVRLTTRRGAQKLLESLEKSGEIRRVINGGKKTKSGNTNRYQIIPYRIANGLENEQPKAINAKKAMNNGSSDGVNGDSSDEDGVNSGSSDGVNSGSSDGVNSGSSNPFIDPSDDPLFKNLSLGGDTEGGPSLYDHVFDAAILFNLERAKAAEKPNKPVIDFDTYKAKLKEIFPTVPGSACNHLYNMLQGRSKTGKWQDYNISPPVDFGELEQFGQWYVENFPGQIKLKRPETISEYIELFREGYVAEDNDSEPIPEYHREYVPEDKPPLYKQQVDEITDMLEDLFSIERVLGKHRPPESESVAK